MGLVALISLGLLQCDVELDLLSFLLLKNGLLLADLSDFLRLLDCLLDLAAFDH
jgi:hypothetical protein